MKDYLIRRRYLDKIGAGRDDCDVIKVITGIRRSGKSVLMKLYRDELIASGVSESDIIYIDFESFEGRKIKTSEQLDEQIVPKIPRDRTCYVMFDEIQNVDGWELTLSSLNSAGNCDVYVTGSNYKMLSSDLATHIAGRYVEIKVFPLSMKEFSVKNGYSNKDEALSDYIRYGGMPGIDPSKGWEFCKNQLEGMFNTVMIKDVQKHEGLVDSDNISSIAHFIQANIGNITNNSIIAKDLKLGVNTVDRYISSMLNAFLFYRCPKYDMVGRKILKTNGKYYVTDLGMRNAELGMTTGCDISRPLENIVFLELILRGYDVRVGCYHDSEVDFIASKDGVIEYYQVCQTMLSEDTMARELRPLEKTRDGYSKKILTLDKIGLGNHNGIQIVNLADWLMESDI